MQKASDNKNNSGGGFRGSIYEDNKQKIEFLYG